LPLPTLGVINYNIRYDYKTVIIILLYCDFLLYGLVNSVSIGGHYWLTRKLIISNKPNNAQTLQIQQFIIIQCDYFDALNNINITYSPYKATSPQQMSAHFRHYQRLLILWFLMIFNN
jgi:hypothetical protein